MSGGQSFFREASRSSSIVGGGKQRLRLPQMDSIEAAPERPQALGESSAEAGFLPALLQSASLAPAASSDHRQRPSTALLTRLGSAPRGLQLADGMAPLLRTNSRTGAGNLRPADSLTQPATPFPLEDSASTVRHPCQLQSTTPFADGYAGRLEPQLEPIRYHHTLSMYHFISVPTGSINMPDTIVVGLDSLVMTFFCDRSAIERSVRSSIGGSQLAEAAFQLEAETMDSRSQQRVNRKAA